MTKNSIKKSLCGLAVGCLSALCIGIQVNADSAVNSYIMDNNLQPVKTTSAIWSGFPKNNYTTGKPNGVVVHETANPNSTIYGEISYMKSNYQNAFVHTFIDASRVINIANTNYLAWGCGYPGNGRFIQFEQVEVHSKSAFAKEVNNAANYTASMLKQYNLPLDNAVNDGKGTVWSHKAVSTFLGGTDHGDPDGYYASNGSKYFGEPYTMNDFYSLVKYYYGGSSAGTSQPTSNTTATPKNTTATKPAVKYYKGQGNETAKLSATYSRYKLYNHVKGTSRQEAKYSFSSQPAFVGKTVYVDSRAVTSKGSTWYRIRFAKNTTKKYWVYSKALSFNPISFSDSNKTITIKNGKYSLRNHVYNTKYLSTVAGNTSNILNQSFKVNKVGIKTHSTGQTTWYRINVNGKNVWVCEQAL